MNIFMGLVVIGIGILNIAKPRAMAQLRLMHIKNAEPSDYSIIMNVILGVILVFAGIILCCTPNS